MKAIAGIEGVLPASVHDLSYENLEIGNGGYAMAVLANMLLGGHTQDETVSLHNALLEYRNLDT